jgi:predicted PurR-regulated permease PerM
MSTAFLRRARRDPTEGETEEQKGEILSREDEFLVRLALMSIIFLGMVALTSVLYVARPVIVPIVAAFVVGLMVAPIGERFQQFGVPKLLINLLILANVAAAAVLASIFLAPKIEIFFADLPFQMQKISSQLELIMRPLDNLQSAMSSKTAPSTAGDAKSSAFDAKAIAVYALGALTPAVTQILIFAFALIMFLIDRPLIKRAIVMAFETRERRLEALKFVNQMEASLSQYLSTVFVINLGVAVLTTLMLFALGMPGYIPLGVAAFFLNFLPIIGPLVLKGGLLLLGLATYPTIIQGLIPVTLYTVLVMIESNFVTPFLVGRRFSMPPLVVFISIMFWTWLWGLTGALLAMPLLVIGSTIIDRYLTEEKLTLPG